MPQTIASPTAHPGSGRGRSSRGGGASSASTSSATRFSGHISGGRVADGRGGTSSSSSGHGHTTLLAGSGSAFDMGSLRDTLEGMVHDKVEPLSRRVAVLEDEMKEWKSKVGEFERKLESYSDEATKVDTGMFDSVEKKLKRVQNGMKKLDVTNRNILRQGALLGKAVQDLRTKSILHDKLHKKLLVYGQDVVKYLEGRIEDVEDDILLAGIENTTNDVKMDKKAAEDELEKSASEIEDMFNECDETFSSEELDKILEVSSDNEESDSESDSDFDSEFESLTEDGKCNEHFFLETYLKSSHS